MTVNTGFYKKLHPNIRNFAKYACSFIPLRIRLGRHFFKELEFLEKSQWWTSDKLKGYQLEQLNRLIRHAYNHVPYYRKLFDALKLRPEDIREIEDLEKIPVLTKEIVRSNLSELRAKNFKDRDILELSTSGTTGIPLIFYYERKKNYLDFDPFIWRYFGWAGHRLGERRAVLSSWTLEKNQTTSFNPFRNLLILSAYTLNADNVKQYADALKKYRIEFIQGYPSSIELLTKFFKQMNLSCPIKTKAIFTHSEYIYAWQRKEIEAFWGCPCFDWYGLEERVILGVECEYHRGLHLCPEFSIAEFIDVGNDPCRKIISTSLTNFAMPFIRYDTGDFGYLLHEQCACHRSFPLFKLEGGREKGFAIAKDGSCIPVANVDIPSVTDQVFQFQFVQELRGHLFLNIVKKPSFNDTDLAMIRNKLSEKFGLNMDVTINFRQSIQATENMKASIFIQKMRDL